MTETPADRAETVELLLREVPRLVAGNVMFMQAVGEQLGINATDLQLLNVLTAGGPVTAGTLSRQTGLTTGATSRAVDRLERAELVRRRRDDTDRRKVYVELVWERQAAVADVFESMRQGWLTLLARYDDAELLVLLDLVRASQALAQRETRRLRDGGAAAPPPGPDHSAGAGTGDRVATSRSSRVATSAGPSQPR